MAESVPVRCPVCRRETSFTPTTYPCPCGVPVSPPLLSGEVPVPVRHRTWAGSWVEVRCPSCGRHDEWPQPELGCSCGAMLRLAVTPSPCPAAPPHTLAGHPAHGREEGLAAASPRPAASATPPRASSSIQARLRPAFRPVTIRTARDAVTAAAQYLRWLGFTDVREVRTRPPSGVDLRGPEVVAQVDPTTTPTTLKDIETLWLNGLHEETVAVSFSLAGYSRKARSRADELRVPLFVLDLTGTPQPVNDPADGLLRGGV